MKYNNFLLHHLSVYYMLMACFYNSLTGVFAKLLGAQISSLEVVLFRNLPGLLILLYKIKARPRAARFANKGGHPFTLAFRGIIGILGLMVFFYNIANISLGEAFTFQKTAPIWTAIIAYFTLGEKFGAMGWFSVCLGFVGIV